MKSKVEGGRAGGCEGVGGCDEGVAFWMQARWEKHCTGAPLPEGGLPGNAKKWGNFDHAYVEFCFVALATDARLCTSDANN